MFEKIALYTICTRLNSYYRAIGGKKLRLLPMETMNAIPNREISSI